MGINRTEKYIVINFDNKGKKTCEIKFLKYGEICFQNKLNKIHFFKNKKS